MKNTCVIIKNIIILLFYVTTTGVVSAKPMLTVELNKNEVEYGKSITATIIASDISQPIEQLNLNELRQNFYIKQKSYDKQASTQKLVLKLYPRIQGAMVIPVLKLAEVSSALQKVKVTTGKVKGEKIKLKVTRSGNRVWQRQQLRVTLEVITSDQFARLKTQAPVLSGFKIIPLDSSREWKKYNGIKKTILRTGWAIYPLLHGDQILELPAITYHVGGVQKRAYYLHQIHLNIKKLPPYIPPTLPVGKIILESSLESGYIPGNNSLTFWNLSLKSTDVIPQWFPAILRQIESNGALKFFPADSKRTLKKTDKMIQSGVVHRIPFKITSSGWHTLPAPGFKYFDPKSGRLVNVELPAATRFSLGAIWMVFAGLAGVIVIFYVLYKMSSAILELSSKRQKINKLLNELQQVDNFEQLRSLLREYAKIQKWPCNTSLREWFANWSGCFKVDAAMQVLIKKISTASYANQNQENITSLRLQLYQHMKQPKKIRTVVFTKSFPYVRAKQ